MGGRVTSRSGCCWIPTPSSSGSLTAGAWPCRAHHVIADEANDIVVSAASAWEITTKYRIGKLAGAEPVALDVTGAISAQGFGQLPIRVVDAERAGRLPHPFDRVLAAQALACDLAVVSADAALDAYGIRRI